MEQHDREATGLHPKRLESDELFDFRTSIDWADGSPTAELAICLTPEDVPATAARGTALDPAITKRFILGLVSAQGAGNLGHSWHGRFNGADTQRAQSAWHGYTSGTCPADAHASNVHS